MEFRRGVRAADQLCGRPACLQLNRAGMPHHADRPTKICVCCGRPFQWRRKWKAVWDEVRYCSDRCRREVRRRRPDSKNPSGGPEG
jgi:hypothetical protein